MSFLSFGKIAIKKDNIDVFLKEASEKGLSVKHIKANIYEFGLNQPSLLNPDLLKKEAGLLGLKHGEI